MKIIDIDPSSPLFGYVRPGFSVVAVNGEQVQDTIDFRYKIAEERVNIRFADQRGEELEFDFDEVDAADLGITLDDSKVKMCKCDCIFCFVRQQPKGMRRALYIKDEDYRLSFTHGNFITLSNMTKPDLDRIINQRLSPMYVSVHATDDTLRRCMLRNEKLAPIVPQLKYLGDNGITIHTQVVLCPGINDGPQLVKTVTDLAALYPSIETLAVVPVGLTKYREDLAKLRTYTVEEARDVISYVEKQQKEYLQVHGTRFVWPADEFYVIAGNGFPRLNTYEEMNQFENGVGMVREFITSFNRRRSRLKNLNLDCHTDQADVPTVPAPAGGGSVNRRFEGEMAGSLERQVTIGASRQSGPVATSKWRVSGNRGKRALFLTGYSAAPFLRKYILPYVREELGLTLDIQPVTNRFWGESVTVSGLLTGQDMLREARKRIDDYDTLVLPPNCLNQDDLFLDNLTLDQFRSVLGKDVQVGQYDCAATLRSAFS